TQIFGDRPVFSSDDGASHRGSLQQRIVVTFQVRGADISIQRIIKGGHLFERQMPLVVAARNQLDVRQSTQWRDELNESFRGSGAIAGPAQPKPARARYLWCRGWRKETSVHSMRQMDQARHMQRKDVVEPPGNNMDPLKARP